MREDCGLPTRHPLVASLSEALEAPHFASSWRSKCDPSFRAFAAAAIALRRDLRELPLIARRGFYDDLTRRKRAPLLAMLSGRAVAPGDLGLFAKTEWPGMRRRDWNTLIVAAAAPDLRKPLGHTPLITSRLLRQVRCLPQQLMLPRILMILNFIELSTAQRRVLRELAVEASPPQLAGLGAAARRVVTLGDFWDFWQAVIAHGGGDDSVDAFGLPQEAFASKILSPVTSPEDLHFEGRKMRNCLGSMSWRATTGRAIFFRARSGAPFSAELRREEGRWTPGSILGAQNARLDDDARASIQSELEAIAATLPISRACRREPLTRPEIASWRAYARNRFSDEEIAYLSGRLEETFPAPGAKAVETVYYGRKGGRRVALMASHEGDIYHLDLTSHHDDGSLALYLGSRAIAFLQEAGFDWPRSAGSRSFTKRFVVDSRQDCRGIAEIALAVLGKVYACRAGAPPWRRYEAINPVPDYGSPWEDDVVEHARMAL